MDVKALRIAFLGAVFWVFACGLVLLYGWPFPESWKQWALLIALGPPSFFLGEAACDWIFSRINGEASSERSFSVARVILAVLVVIIVVAIGWAAAQLLTEIIFS
jgi:hypothetical protein